MASYPSSIYSPRDKENKSGVVYDESKKTVIFAEDIEKDDAEIVAIETELGINPKGIFESVKACLEYLITFSSNLYKRSMDEFWKTMDGWTQDVVGSGGDSNELMRLDMQTGATINSRVSRYTGVCRGGPHLINQRGITQISMRTDPANCEIRFYVVHGNESAAPLIDTDEHGGFKIINGDIYASNANGVTETETDTGVDIDSGSLFTLEIKGTNSSIEFYVDGNLKATHTTNLPQNFSYIYVLEIKNTTAENKRIYVLFVRHTD